MNVYRVLLLVAVFCCSAHSVSARVAAGVLVSSDSVWFGRIEAGTEAVDTIWVKPGSAFSPTVLSVSVAAGHSDFSVDPLSGGAIADSLAVVVRYSSRHNVRRSGVLFIRVSDDGSVYSLAVRLAGESFYTDPTYEFTDNLYGKALVDALRGYIQGHTALSYNQARDIMFGTIDKRAGDTLECPYSGRKIRAANRTEAQSKNFNTEHTWPQSRGAEEEPPKSDIHHLRATDLTANDKRANFPFGNVVSNVQYEQGGSRLGRDAGGTTVFEVRDRYKGDIARGMFYFAVRYNNPSAYLNQQEATLRQWSVADQVDEEESARNTAIAQWQKRRNPFVDHPEFMERIYSLSSAADFPRIADPVAADTVLWLFLQSDRNELPVLFGNRGTDTAFIRSVEIRRNADAANELITGVDSAIAPGGMARIAIARPAFAGLSDTLKVTVKFAQGVPQQTVEVQFVSLTGVGEKEVRPEYLRAVPNPFSGATSVVVPVLSCSDPVVRVVTPLGNDVHDIGISAERGEVLKLHFRPPASLSAGLYFCRIDCGDRVFICPLYMAR